MRPPIKPDYLNYGKIPPQAPDLEENVLGAIMLENKAIDSIINILTPESFYKESHSLIYRAILALKERKDPIDIGTVTHELKKSGALDLVGGPYYVTTLTNKVASSANIKYHARIIAQKYLQRNLIQICYESIHEAYEDSCDVFELREKVIKCIKDEELSIVSEKIYSPTETIDEVIVSTKETEKQRGIVGWPTGITAIDKATLGIQRQMKYTIGALPSVGKTAFAKSILINLAHVVNVPGIFFSMEMTRKQLMIQCISQMLQIENQLIRTGKLTPFDYNMIEEIKKGFFAKNFIIHDESGLTHQKMEILIKQAKEEYGIGWFAVDHIGKMKHKNSKGMTIEARVSENTSQVKNFAKDYNLAAIELTQLTKETNKRKDMRPAVGDIRDSGAIESEADVLMLLYRPEHHGIKTYQGADTKGFAEIILAKNRDGPIGNYVARYIAQYTQFINHEGGIMIEREEEETDVF